MHASTLWITIGLALTGCAADSSSTSRIELVSSTGAVTPLGSYEPATRALRFDTRVGDRADVWTVVRVAADRAPVPIEPGVVVVDRDLDPADELPAFTLRPTADGVSAPPEPAGVIRLVADPDGGDDDELGQSSQALVDSGGGGTPVECTFLPDYGQPEYWLHGCAYCFGWADQTYVSFGFCW